MLLYSIRWLQHTLKTPNLKIPKADILIDMADSTFLLGDIESAAELARKAEKAKGTTSRPRRNLQKIKEYQTKNATMFKENRGKRPKPVATISTWKRDITNEYQNYERLCNDKNPALNYTTPSTFCHIRNKNNYFAWAKEEIFSTDPFIAMVHDVITDQEAEMFKQLGKNCTFPIKEWAGKDTWDSPSTAMVGLLVGWRTFLEPFWCSQSPKIKNRIT